MSTSALDSMRNTLILGSVLSLVSCGGGSDVAGPEPEAVVETRAATQLTAQAAATYTMMNLGTLPNAHNSFGYGINSAGHVVGGSKGRAFLWTPETGMRELVRLSSRGGATAQAINGSNDVAGVSTAANGKDHPVRWHNGVVRDLGTLSGANSGTSSGSAADLNDAGQIVGSISVAPGRSEAFIWQNGVMKRLTPDAGLNSAATAINAAGQVVGYVVGREGRHRAFIWQNGSMRGLGDLGGHSSDAEGINGLGHVVGTSATAGGATHAFLWKDGVMTDIGDFRARDINARDQVVGGTVFKAVVWDHGVLSELGDFGQSSTAADINGAGQIAGEAEENTERGYVRAARWTPSP